MTENPYQSPESMSAGSSKVRTKKRRNPWGYLLAAAFGFTCMTPMLMPFLADLDDAGSLEMLIGVFMSVVVYHFLWPHRTVEIDRQIDGNEARKKV